MVTYDTTDKRFSGRIVIVTGAASGIGAATSRRLLGEGAALVLVDIDEAKLAAMQREVAEAGGACRAIVGSAALSETWTEAVKATDALAGRIDGLFNNAGITGALAPFDRADPQDFERLIDVNLRSVLLGMRAVLPRMLAHGRGAIVNTASISAVRGMPGFSHYGMTKAAVVNVTQTTAIELGARGVRVNAVCPGVIDTSIMADWDRSAGDDKAAARREALVRTIPMRRYGTAEEVGAAVAFLLSDDAAYVTGAALAVDGGTLAR
jgi:NAD(P)-dependent dehydrogenase (short-subunit alcohol dehydrogenase family)